MPDPARPVAGAPIDTDWGQQVHDAVFTPRGTRVAGGASSSVDAAFEQLQLNTAVDDPGGWLASDTLTVPAGAGGLYHVLGRIRTDNGDVGQETRWQVRVNGTTELSGRIDCEGTTAVTEPFADLFDLDAGDQIQVWAAKTGGPSQDVLVVALAVLRAGSEIGA